MKEHCYSLFTFLLFGLFSILQGKLCPEQTRPHSTRCDAYYKCTELTNNKHVWMPLQCEEGLIYEHSLAVCVLPADDWECLMVDPKTNKNLNENSKTTRNVDADIYIVSNGEDQDGSKYDDSKLEIIIGPDISEEDKTEEDAEKLYDGSGNGGELIELDGFMPAENRKVEVDNTAAIKKYDNLTANKTEEQKVEQKEELEEVVHSIKTKSEKGQSSSNIDAKLTAHLQRLSQLIDGLKQNYQATEAKPQKEHDLRPDQLNAFLAHFNIKNKFDSLDPNEGIKEVSSTSDSTLNLNKTFSYNQSNIRLNPETKVILSDPLPQHYDQTAYSNSQIVINRPEGSVLFSLPDHHDNMEYPEYFSDHSPKISKETLRTVLELSKQMIAQQNVPKVIPNPTYFASPIMQPILLTPHIDSPFSTNYINPASNSLGISGQYNTDAAYDQNFKYKKPVKRPSLNLVKNGYYNNDNNNKPATTIIHNNVIPVHVSAPNSAEKEVLHSYGQNVPLYPPAFEENPDSKLEHYSNSNDDFNLSFQNAEYSVPTTKKPSYINTPVISSQYDSTPKPFEFQTTANTISDYFTPSEHLSDHNVNTVFSSVNSFGSIPRPIKDKKPNFQNYKNSQQNTDKDSDYSVQNQLFPQVNSYKVHVRPNSQYFESFENDVLNNYPVDNNEDETPLITYSYGIKKKSEQPGQFSNYGDSDSQSAINTVFSTNNPYTSKTQSNSHNSIPSSNSHYLSAKNKYSHIPSYAEGTQLVNIGGNFISFEVFRNSILPLLGKNPTGISSTLNNVEMITCATGVRQPNSTDCTRYYVCSKKDGKVLSYSCPPYTAFDSDTRICNAKTYALCSPDPIVPSYLISENKRIQMEAIKAIQEAKRIQMLQQQQQQAIKTQNIANLLQQHNPFYSPSNNNELTASNQDSSEQNFFSSYVQHTASTTPRPQITAPTVKKRKYYCKEGDKIADQTSIYNYFVCYKNAKGQMKGHRMTCSKGLLFCPKSTMCTLASKCS